MSAMEAVIRSMGGQGVSVQLKGRRYLLDPRTPQPCDAMFISHAHIDHIPSSSNGQRAVASSETLHLARCRGVPLRGRNPPSSMELLDSGHMLGSRSVLLDGTVCYTGDMSARSRAFMKKIEPVKCKVLIVESTFGLQRYVFPPVANIVGEVNGLIAKLFANGVPVVLMGYSLGKAQILLDLFGSWSPLYVESSVALFNDAYRKLNIELPQAEEISDVEKSHMLKSKPWLMIAPLRSGRSSLVKKLKQLYGAVTVGFSGWSIDPGYKFSMGLDYAFPLSDHADFQELSQFVDACDPEKVYTVHGFTHEFAAYLRRKGYDAEPLEREQRSIREFLTDLE